MWEATPGCGGAPFLDTLWTAVDEAIELPDCDVYSYKSDGEADPFSAAPHLQAALHGSAHHSALCRSCVAQRCAAAAPACSCQLCPAYGIW